MAEDLRKETARGIIWSGIDKIANGGIMFLANIMLARLLTPKDFGLLAIIAIFIQISQTFIDSGFSNALIQKKNRSQSDYSTVFFFNLAISVGAYLILFFCAPLISRFFNDEKLVSLTRVVGLNLVFGALISVHKTRLTVQLRFKVQSIISLAASATSAIFAIFLAYRGFGVWSLVMLSLLNILLQTILIYVFIRWRPSLLFSKRSFRQLFSYSSKLLGASLIHLLYKNIYPIVIGKRFSSIELGYFNRADTLAMYPSSTIGNVISRVAFPIFSRIQDNNARLCNAYSKYIVYSSLVIFPLMIWLIVLAHPLTLCVLKEKWLPMVPLLQILCIDWMTDHLCLINLNVLYVKGRSDLAFRLEVIKKTIAIIIFFVSMKWGLEGVCWGRVIYGFIAVCINSSYTKCLIGMSFLRQLKDITTPLIISAAMGCCCLIIKELFNNPCLSIVISTLSGILFYFIMIFKFKRNNLKEIYNLINKQIE